MVDEFKLCLRDFFIVEIKSTDRVTVEDIASLRRLGPDIPNSQPYCFSRDPHPKMIEGVRCLPWAEGLEELGL